MTNFKAIAGIFVILTLALGASTGYLLTASGGATTTRTTTVTGPTSTSTMTSTLTSTQTASSPAGSSPYSIALAFKPSLGTYLTNGSGWTLYLFTNDTPNNGTSACYGQCAKFWPPFYASKTNVPPGLNASSFGSVTRTDGTKQTTYNGWPLYYFAPDKLAGQTNGQGVAGIWYTVSPTTGASGMIAGSPQSSIDVAYKQGIGGYFTNGTGFTLYVFLKDKPDNGTSACYGACAAAWPPFYSAHIVAPPGVNASLFGTITRTDGTKQTTYDGYPLYYYAADKLAGQTNGQDIGGVWYAWSLPEPDDLTNSTSS